MLYVFHVLSVVIWSKQHVAGLLFHNFLHYRVLMRHHLFLLVGCFICDIPTPVVIVVVLGSLVRHSQDQGWTSLDNRVVSEV